MLLAFFISAVNACQSVSLFSSLSCLDGWLTVIRICRPLSAFWNPLAEYPHHCIDEGNYMLSFGILTIILDFATLLLPVPLVMSLQLTTKQRIAVLTLFGLGFVVCIAGIVQVYYVDFALKKSYDETWDGWPLWVASAVQVDVGIVSPSSQVIFSRMCCSPILKAAHTNLRLLSTALRLHPRHPPFPRHLRPPPPRIHRDEIPQSAANNQIQHHQKPLPLRRQEQFGEYTLGQGP